MLRNCCTILFLCLISGQSFSIGPVSKLTAGDYIDIFNEDAFEEMMEHGVPASITLAQGMLESGYGNSKLAVYANNHFGIKCHKEWDGATFNMDDDEKNECFRKYDNVIDSYSDHSLFLKNRPRYSFLFELSLTDYRAWANGLKNVGYATHPNYATDLIEIIEKYRLYELDRNGYIPELNSIKEYSPNTPHVAVKQKKENFLYIHNIHEVVKFNKTEFVVVKKGDTFNKIAREFHITTALLLQYNNAYIKEKLVVGEKIYLKPKRSKAIEQYHLVCKGETMLSISQLYGIKMMSLYKKNRMEPGTQPNPDDILYLRKRKPKE